MHTPPAPLESAVLCSKVRLTLAAKSLKDLDLFSKSDPICVVYLTSGPARGSIRTVEVGRTECIMNNLNPEWAKTILVDYFFEEVQTVKFEVYDVDSQSRNLEDHDFIGRAECTLGEIIGSLDSTKWLTLQGDGSCGTLKVIAEEADENSKEVMNVTCRGVNLDKKGFLFFSLSDPFLNFYRMNDDGSRVLAHRTEHINRSLNPQWQPFEIDLRQLCCGDRVRKFLIECYDYRTNGDHKLIGTCETCVDRLVYKEDCQIPLINQKKKLKKGGSYKDSGSLYFQSVTTKRHYSFLEYITGGTRLEFTVAVDFTASNGQVNDPRSLHYISSKLNEYQVAIRAIADICAPYNPSNKFEAMGFGAKVAPRYAQVNHCFPLNLSANNFTVMGIDGLMSAYEQCQKGCQLYGPTNFAPVIDKVTEKVMRTFRRDGSQYQVLLIVTDGVICDFERTVSSIIAASLYPISIIIVGVGGEDFSKMEELDSDDELLSINGRTVRSDIVQFVSLRQFLGRYGMKDSYGPTAMARLAKEVLAEVPGQLTNFMHYSGHKPKETPKPLDQDVPFVTDTVHLNAANGGIYPSMLHMERPPPSAPSAPPLDSNF